MKGTVGVRSLAAALTAAIALIVFQAAAAFGGVIGRGVAGPNGSGTIEISLASAPGGQTVPAADIDKITSIVTDNVQLSNGALPQTIEVSQQGEAIGGVIEFSAAPPGSTVQAELPDEVKRRLAGAFFDGGAAAGGGTSTAAIAGGIGLAVVGGTVGGLYAAGVIGGDDETPTTGSIGPGGQPPGIPPPPPVQPPTGPGGSGGGGGGNQPPPSAFQ